LIPGKQLTGNNLRYAELTISAQRCQIGAKPETKIIVIEKIGTAGGS
jgi:hypothetical protein